MIDAPKPRNLLLAALPARDWDQLKPLFKLTDLPLGEILYEPGERIERLYFPSAGVISTVALFESGSMVEMATTGNEGMVSVAAVLNGRTAIARNIVQVAGAALVIDVEAFIQAQQDIPSFREILFAYAQTFLAQTLQSVACNATHTVEQRAARWLLMTRDRSEGDTFGLTQEFLAVMLAVSRAAVSGVARTLQQANLIRYSRGSITILDREGLEATSCECYGHIRRNYDKRIHPIAQGNGAPLSGNIETAHM